MKLPSEVDMLLGIFRGVYNQEMFLVGGSVRDHYFGKEIRDYDIYLKRDGTRDIVELQILSRSFGMTTTVLLDCDYGACVRMEKEGLTLEVIMPNKTLTEFVDSFPCNISQIYLDESGKVVKHPNFIKYEESGELEFYFETGDYEAKIRRKYA